MTEKADPQIGVRAAEEVEDYMIRHNVGPGAACKALDIPQRQLYCWRDGTAPNALALQNLALHDMDVVYILTGRRQYG